MSENKKGYLELELTQKVLAQLAVFNALEGDKTLIDFGVWLNEQNSLLNPSKALTESEANQKIALHENDVDEDKRASIESSIIRHIYTISRFSKTETHKQLQGQPIATIEEFGLLATLLGKQGLTKSELIRLNMLEISTGTDIIGKLIKHHLIHETLDETDKRVKRLWLSPSAYILLQDIFVKMNEMAAEMLTDLSLAERVQLFSLLNKVRGSFKAMNTVV